MCVTGSSGTSFHGLSCPPQPHRAWHHGSNPWNQSIVSVPFGRHSSSAGVAPSRRGSRLLLEFENGTLPRDDGEQRGGVVVRLVAVAVVVAAVALVAVSAVVGVVAAEEGGQRFCTLFMSRPLRLLSDWPPRWMCTALWFCRATRDMCWPRPRPRPLPRPRFERLPRCRPLRICPGHGGRRGVGQSLPGSAFDGEKD